MALFGITVSWERVFHVRTGIIHRDTTNLLLGYNPFFSLLGIHERLKL